MNACDDCWKKNNIFFHHKIWFPIEIRYSFLFLFFSFRNFQFPQVSQQNTHRPSWMCCSVVTTVFHRSVCCIHFSMFKCSNAHCSAIAACSDDGFSIVSLKWIEKTMTSPFQWKHFYLLFYILWNFLFVCSGCVESLIIFHAIWN